MDARLSAWMALIGWILAAPLVAMPLDDSVTLGRAKLFDGTISGPARACDTFVAGLDGIDTTKTSEYRKLHFLYALARTTILLGHPDDSAVPDVLTRWVEKCSLALTAGAAEMPETNTTNWSRLPWTLVDAEIDAIIAELSLIADGPTPFVMHLHPEETGLRHNLEIDFGDVLMLKSVLLACRASLLESTSVDTTSIDSEQILTAVGAWIGQMPALCGFAHNDDSIDQKHAIWAEAVSCYCDAVSYIAAENNPAGKDPQEDELVYIDPTRLAAIGAGLDDTLGASTDMSIVTYEVYDANSVSLGELTLAFDHPVGGRSGYLTLSNGATLEVDWFGPLDADEMGISMVSSDGATQGWFHGAIAADQGTITGASLDLWGAANQTAKGLTARARTEPSILLNGLLAQQTVHENHWDF